MTLRESQDELEKMLILVGWNFSVEWHRSAKTREGFWTVWIHNPGTLTHVTSQVSKLEALRSAYRIAFAEANRYESMKSKKRIRRQAVDLSETLE